MSRTYRKSSRTNYYHNLEAYEIHHMRWNIVYPRYPTYPSVELTREYFKIFRDGRIKETSHNQSYKRQTNELIRPKSRAMINKIIKDDEYYENATFPTKKDGKAVAWMIW